MVTQHEHYFYSKRLFIFDWSGLVVDDRPPVYEANMRLLAKYSEGPFGMEEWFNGLTGGNASRYLAEITGKPIEKFYDEYAAILNEVREGSRPPRVYRGAPSLFRRIFEQEGIISVVSSHPDPNLKKEIWESGLSGYIARNSGNVTNKTLAIQQECLAAKVTPEEAVYSGDMSLDVRSAHEAGVMAVAVADGYHSWEMLKAENPHLLVPNLVYLVEMEW